MAINISSPYIALKYVKYFCLGQNPKNTSQSDLGFSICHRNFEVKQQYQ